MHTSSPNKPKKFKKSFSLKKVDGYDVWDQKEILLIDLIEPGTMINIQMGSLWPPTVQPGLGVK